MKLTSLFLFVLILTACHHEPERSKPQGEDDKAFVSNHVLTNKKALNFIALGDFGMGGKENQGVVANAMGKIADTMGSSFIVSTGDNFYPNGVTSINDDGWKRSYERIYTAPSLQKDWYVVLGNHDYKGNTDAQVQYSSISKRWHMPAHYFYRNFAINGDTMNQVLIIFLDTNPLIPSYYNSGEYQKNVEAQDSLAQKNWLKKVLQSDTSHVKWRIVVGHHPLYTGGRYEDDKSVEELQATLKPVLDQYKVDVYISGHDHSLQYIKPPGRTHYFISGAGSQLYSAERYPSIGEFAASVNGFMSFSVTPAEVLVQVINAKGEVIYKTAITK